MLNIHIENIGELSIIECQGRIVQSVAAFKLRKAVLSQMQSKTIVLDLTEVHAIEGGGLGMLSSLQLWAHDRGIELKLFNPRSSVQNRLEHNEPVQFHIAPFEEMMSLLAIAEEPEFKTVAAEGHQAQAA
jgi:anti-anti-sigma regulatory factor